MVAMVPEIAAPFGIAESAYHLGTMIEVPRAALLADELAAQVEFFSFGTNDLTQTTFGLSRDDAGGFLPHYVAKGLLPSDPFAKLDASGVGALMAMAIEKARSARADIKLGICGEHGGDPSSIGLCEAMGMDYVSCSPFRVPIARLAAAQSAIRAREKS
jgi:pyruvate,orthophosphate dikinase